jgi:uncharacterized SAM-binding protein YcdF (DUF218 family)
VEEQARLTEVGRGTMFFILSKTLGILTVPSHVITLLAVAGFGLLCTRFARAGRRFLAVSLVLFVVLGILPVGRALILILEERFPPWADQGRAPDGIIILGGAIDPEASAARGMVQMDGNAERLIEIARLARRFPDARIVFTGGSANLLLAGPPESAFVLDLFESFGIPRSRVTLEERSRNTVENARFTKALIGPKPGERWLMVTSAIHMPRAMGVFRKADFPVEAYPVDWRTGGWSGWWRGPVWPLNGLNATDFAAKEWIGLLSYRVAGYIPDLLPGPQPPP